MHYSNILILQVHNIIKIMYNAIDVTLLKERNKRISFILFLIETKNVLWKSETF